MSREYKHIRQHEKKLVEMKQQGLTHREMGEKLGYSKQQIKEFFVHITNGKGNYHLE